MNRPRNRVAVIVGRWVIGPLLALAVIVGLIALIVWGIQGIAGMLS